MKVIEDTDDRLVIEDRPWLFAGLMAAMIVFSIALLFIAWRDGNLALGLTMLFTFGCAIAGFRLTNRRMRLTLDQSTDQVTMKIQTSKGMETRRWPLSQVRASIQTHRHSESVTTRPVLLIDTTTPPERHVLSPIYRSGDAAEKIASRIKAFIENKNARV